MSLFRIQSDGKISGIKTEEFPDEKTIEDLIEKQPSMILGGDPLLIIGRQVITDYGTKIDLLGLESSGNTVIIELKLGLTPREVITQILEYAVWVQNLQYAELNKIAIDQLHVKCLREHYLTYFGEIGAIENIIENVNREQLLVILGKRD